MAYRLNANGLTLLQQRFVNAIIAQGEEHRNGKEAARIAGYKGDDNTLTAIASQNLSKLNIIAAIEAAEQSAATAAGATAEWIKEQLIKLAEQSLKVQTIVDKDGNVKELQDSAGASRALELLGRAAGIFEADNKQQRPKVSIRNFSGSKTASDSNDD
jgi:phage terminase small subunit